MTKGLVTTERLRLVPIGPQHADELWRLHQDEAIAEWYREKWTKEQATRRARDMGLGWQRDGASKWLAYELETNQLVGRGGLSIKEIEGTPQLEVGWAIVGRMWGNGYATEIGAAGLAYAFGELRAAEVVAFTEPFNVRSRAVMERLGMQFRRDIMWKEEVTQMEEPFVLYSIDRSSWQGTGRV